MKRLQPHSPRGFTLLELLVVLLILGILYMLVAPQFFGQTENAQITAAKTQIRNFETALAMYRLDNNGQYPTTEQGLKALIEKPTSEPIPKNWRSSGYLSPKVLPDDPWGRKYEYKNPSEHGGEIDIYSHGKNKDSADDDIGNWKL